MDKFQFQSDVIDHVLGNEALLSFEDQVVTTGFLSGLLKVDTSSEFRQAITGGEKKADASYQAMIKFGSKVREKLDAGGFHEFTENVLSFVDACPNIAIEVNSDKQLLELAEQLEGYSVEEKYGVAM